MLRYATNCFPNSRASSAAIATFVCAFRVRRRALFSLAQAAAKIFTLALALWCALLPAHGQAETDPWEGYNRWMFGANDGLDRYLVRPVAKGYDVINLGSGNGSTVLEMINAFERATGIAIPYSLAPRREGDVPAVYANIGKAQRVLNWTPEKTLEDMLRDAWNFEQSL